tara:strand:+ start:591 stop:1310 length:720 start_codon:yes stop_codon:yes gene_type:complete
MFKEKKLIPIAKISSPFQEKFGIPHQAGLSPSVQGFVVMQPNYQDEKAFLGIENFSHLWLIFGFHESNYSKWLPLVRPPRLGGNSYKGVFATRSPFRPNGLGLSVVKFDGIDKNSGQLCLKISGLDLLDKTPIYDIKPYLLKSDRPVGAKSGIFDGGMISKLEVIYSDKSSKTLRDIPESEKFKRLITETLTLDPRPAYKKQKLDKKLYAMRLDSYDIRWQIENEKVIVREIVNISSME